KNKTASIPTLRTDQGEQIKDLADKAEVLNQYFAQTCTMPKSLCDKQLSAFPVRTTKQLTKCVVSENDVFKILSRLNINKAGAPGLSNRVLRELAPVIVSPFAQLINGSFASDVFPACWKLGFTNAPYKTGDAHLEKNYRLITLPLALSKCVRQSGFKKQDETITQLHEIIHYINKGMDENVFVQGVFLDISKAFDTVWHRGLLHKLESYGIKGSLLQWFKSYLSDRRIVTVVSGTTSTERKINSGMLQGSVLGPLLFLLYINDIDDNLENLCKLFADDTCIFGSGRDLKLSVDALNRDLQRLSEWSDTWSLSFNVKKCKSILFMKNRRLASPTLGMNNINIPLSDVDEHVHLGLLFSTDMTWTKHVDRLVAKVNSLIGA
ncbi:unnamed protein product, partial [Didymodactylos carnosus]